MSEVHCLNALSPMERIDPRPVTDVSELQPAKAACGISVTPAGTVKVVSQEEQKQFSCLPAVLAHRDGQSTAIGGAGGVDAGGA